jgi:lipoprotein-releasing system permease protein
MPWYLQLALRQLFPAGKRFGSSFFLLSATGVALGVAVLVVVQSVMGGFGMVHRGRIVDLSGHMEINATGAPMRYWQPLVDKLAAHPEVEGVTPLAQGFVMAMTNSIPVFPWVFGIEPQDEPVIAIHRYMVDGSLDDLHEDAVLVSRTLARQLGIWVGSEIEVYTPLMIERLRADEILLPRQFAVVGIYDLEWNRDYTPGMVFTLRTMQDFYLLDDAVHGIAIRLRDAADEFALQPVFKEWAPSYWQVVTWKERWADFLWVLDLEKTMMLFLNLVIVAVAVFAISAAQLLTVIRKTREIGLLHVLCANPRQIPLVYSLQGVLIGVVGLVVGIALGLALLAVRDPIIGFLSDISGTRETLVRFYYFAHLPVRYSATDFIVISVSAVVLSTLASVLPAWRAGRMQPATCLRVEQ